MTDLSKQITKEKILAYQRRLESLGLAQATIKRRMASLRKFCQWATDNDHLKENPFVSPVRKAITIPDRMKLAIGLAVIVILALLAGQRYFYQGKLTTKVIATYSPWIINFKGKLSDSEGNPLAGPAKIYFRLYEQAEGGVPLWYSKPWELEPDSQGEFQAPLGNTAKGDFELPYETFFQKERLYLGVTLDGQMENTPRLPVSTAAHAADSLHLDNFPPSQSPSGNMVPVLTPEGFLILAAPSPKIKSTQGTFAIEGQAISLFTTTGSDGNITLAPDGSGVLNLLLSSPTGDVINAQDANLGSQGTKEENTLFSGRVANDSANFNLLKLESGSTPTAKFTVDASGHVNAQALDVAGNTKIGGRLDIAGIGLNDQGTSRTDSGASLVGTYDEFANSNSATVQDVLDDLDHLLARVNAGDAGLWLRGNYGTFENDYPVIVGADADFVHFAEGLGDLKVASDLEVLGTAYFGGSTDYLQISSTNLTANAASTWQTTAGALTINATSGDLTLKTTASGNLVLDSAGGTIDIDDATLDLSSQATNVNLINSTINALTFETSLLTLDTQNSRVGIGQSTPLSTLDVGGSASISGNLVLAGGARVISGTAMNTLQIGDTSTGLIKIGTGISNTTATGTGDLYVSGDFEVDGNVLLGESTTNTLTVSSYITSDLIPNPGSQYDLGSNTRRWQDVYADNVNASNLTGMVVTGSTSSYDWSIGVGYTGPDAQDMTLTFERGSPAVNTEIRWDSTNKYLSTNSPGFAILPDSNITASGKAALIVNQIQNQDIFTASSSGVPKFVINNAGNVGIGTTAPSGKLHVVGECVAWDSLIPVKSSPAERDPASREKLKVKNTSEEGLAYVKIKDIKPGDYVLSLNEETGNFEWQMVEKTLDKGYQEVYELITESGKRIETTGNHPYLIKDNSQQKTRINADSLTDIHTDVVVPALSGYNLANNPQLVKTQFPKGVDPRGVEPLLPALTEQVPHRRRPTPDSLFQKETANASWTKVIYLKEGMEIAVANTIRVNTSEVKEFAEGEGDTSEVKLQWERIISIRKTGIRHVYDLQIANTANFVAGHWILKNTSDGGPERPKGVEWDSSEVDYPRCEENSTSKVCKVFGGIVAHNTFINSSSTTTPALNIDSTGAVISGNAAGLDINVSNTSTSVPAAVITNAGSGFSLRVNDDGTYTDATPFVIDSAGNVGIGDASPAYLLTVGSGDLFGVNSSGYALLPAGAVGTPSLSFTADTNTGLWSSAADTLNLSTAGSERVRINSSGNVGIGTTAPTAGFALDVIGAGRFSNGLTVAAGTVSLPASQIDNAELANSSITVTAGTGLITGGTVSLGGSVTIDLGTLTGLTAGADTLAVNYGSTANTAAQGNVTLTGPGAGTGLTGGGGTIAVGAGGTFTTLNVIGGTCITANADDVAVTADCIGDTQLLYNTGQHLTTGSSPTFVSLTLSQATGTSPLAVSSTTVNTNLNADMVDSQHYSSSWPNPSDMVTGSGTSNYVSKWTGTYTQGDSIIRDDGTYVGIGTAPGTYKLNVYGSGDVLRSSGGTSGVYATGSTYGVYGNSSGTGMYGYGGTIGVQGWGTTSGVYGQSSNTGVQGYGTSYDFYAAGPGTDYGTSSSIRWKKNISEIKGALEAVKNLRAVSFDWDEAHGGRHAIGFIAEEIGQYFPEIVGWDEENPGYTTGMDYSKMTPVLLQAIKEQQVQIGSLSNQSADLSLTQTGDILVNNGVYEVRNTAGEVVERMANFAETAIGKVKAGLVETTNLITENLIAKRVRVEEKIVSPIAEVQNLKTEVISPLSKGGDITIKLSDVAVQDTSEESPSATSEESHPVSSKSKFRIINEQNVEVASIDSTGNASFAGQVISDTQYVRREATVAGTLYADKVVAGEIVGLKGKFGELLAATVSATYITQNITNIYATPPTTNNTTPGESVPATPGVSEGGESPEPTPTPSTSENNTLGVAGWSASESHDSPEMSATEVNNPEASESATLSESEIEAMVDEILSTSAQATPQAQLGEITNYELRITNNLQVLGTTSLSDTAIAGSLNIGGTLMLADNSLNTFSGPLRLQNLGFGGIELLAGKVVIDTQGNAVFEGDITVKGRLAAKEISPLENQDLVINLANLPTNNTSQESSQFTSEEGDFAPTSEVSVSTPSGFGKLLVRGINNQVVASIDASGSAQFAQLTTGKIIIASNNTPGESVPATPGVDIETNATAGEAILAANETEITIKSPFVTEKTLVYITPVSDTMNQVLYVKAKKAAEATPLGCAAGATPPQGCTDFSEVNLGWFTVGFSQPLPKEIRFNWWIIN